MKIISTTRTFLFAYSIIILLFTAFNSFSQKPNFEFGKIKKEQFDLENYRAKYPGAPAVVISDFGHCKFKLCERSGVFQFIFTKSTRIIILNELGLDYGDISIPYYETKDNRDLISTFTANVYNLSDDKIKKQSIKQKAGYTTDLKNNWKVLNFSLPGVKSGSIIEYTYKIVSDFPEYLPDWRFQRSIPVIYSEFNLDLPSIFIYRMSYRGYEKLHTNNQKAYMETLKLYRKSNVYGNKTTDAGYYLININSTKFSWVAKNLPALVIESHIDNIDNYASVMTFELISYDRYDDTTPPKHIANSWEDVLIYLNKKKGFGDYLINAPAVVYKEFELKSSSDFNTDLQNAFNAVTSRVAWNKSNSLLAQNSVSDVIKNGSGNSAEINLLLCALLRNMGLNAHPVALSTVNNIRLLNSPTYSDLNYIIVAVYDENNNIVLLDATDPDLPVGYIPIRAINGKGYVMMHPKVQAINLLNPEPKTFIKNYHLTLNADGTFEGTFQNKYLQYNSYLLNKDYKKDGKEEFLSSWESIPGLDMIDYNILPPKTPGDPFITEGSFKLEGFAQLINNEMFFEPLLFESIKEHEFKQETRKYPIEYFVASNEEINITIVLPDNIKLIELPRPIRDQWTRAFSYDMTVIEQENKIIISSKKQMLNTRIPPENYNDFVEFLNRIVSGNKQKISLINTSL